jgi:primosomal protein N' (replication factor Y)
MSPIKNLSAIIVDKNMIIPTTNKIGCDIPLDIAIAKAKEFNIPVLLSSATPSLETWIKVKEEK